ncbi:DMT family transporter [Marinoscillum furvescens]|uniref:Drug/metabolite transporter (DMT)-like permease n=1 Tax=Marinoscillum furvescens DSM 4134 TaxID=1122208 RepID=A0A3D9KX73_MARFU|nr:DMT family transporter [Marinoscillum furvescens]RED93373.1 drug/metabolite transporter (DMT)-like permease [Marinoscillum furvescens DSM 4134]
MTQETKDFAFLHFIVLIWGFTAILGVMIDLPSVEMVFFRTLIASVGLLVLVYFRKKSFTFHRRKDYLVILGTGGLIAAHWILFFLSARVANVSVCLAGMATCSLWTSILEPIAYRRKVKAFEVILSVIAFIGIVVIYNVEFDYFLGLVLAVISAFISAWFTVINGKLTKRYDPFVITFYEMIGATLSIALFFPIYLQLEGVSGLALSPTLADWGYLLILGLVCTVYAYSYSVKLMQRLSAFSVNLTVNLEPVYGIVMALIFFPETEQMTSGFYLGTGLILTSVLLYPLINKAMKRKALETDNLR